MSANAKLIEELDSVEINGPALSDERVAEIIRKKSFNYTEAFYFPKTWLELFKRLASAADTIARLEEENGRLKDELGDVQIAIENNPVLAERLIAATAQLEALRVALAPFANWSAKFPNYSDDTIVASILGTKLTFGDFRRAARALSDGGEIG